MAQVVAWSVSAVEETVARAWVAETEGSVWANKQSASLILDIMECDYPGGVEAFFAAEVEDIEADDRNWDMQFPGDDPVSD